MTSTEVMKKNILDEYRNAWDVSPSMNNEKLTSCEQQLIKLDKKELQYSMGLVFGTEFHGFLHSLSRYKMNNEEKDSRCTLLHMIHVFCIPGQEEKKDLVQNYINKELHMMAEKDEYYIFVRYLSQRLKVKSNLTEIDMLTGQIDTHTQFLIILYYWDILCAKNDNQGCQELMKKSADILISNLKGYSPQRLPYAPYMYEHQKLFNGLISFEKCLIACNILLCLLNWNMRTTQPPVTLQNTETPASSTVAFLSNTPKNYSFSEDRVSKILYRLLSTLSEEYIFTVFNKYLDQMFAMKSEITEDDLCTGKIEPYHEFLLKLCYYEKLCNTNNETYWEFLRRNAVFFVAQIEKVVDGNEKNTELQLISWKVLQSLLDFNHQVTPDFQDHTKKLQTILLADILVNFSRFKASHVKLKNSCMSNPNFMLQVAKTFLDISIDPKISQHKKTIVENNLQTILISHDTGKKRLQPTTKFTDLFIGKILDHKRIVSVCINIVKTESKDTNLPIYEEFFWTEQKAIQIEVEMIKRSQGTESLVLLMLVLITITSTGHHKSARLKKYLTLKYEYTTASLHLLWCSGDIEIHPGPSLNKKTLAHDSNIDRRWIQNISPKIIIRLPELLQSKYTATKKVRCDRENRDHFKTLLKTCLEVSILIPKMYIAEINAWETMKYTLLHKLFVYRGEIETIITSLQDFFTCGGSTNDLTEINVSYASELKTDELAMVLGKDQRPTDQSQLMVYITRHIAGISIKCAYGKDPDAKCDGLWDLPLENWPKDIILFDPNNRGKYSKKYPGQKFISDQDLVDNLITLPQVTIPQKYTKIVDAYKLMRKSKNKHNKAELCSIFKRTTSLEKLDYALKNLSENRIFTEEVHDILTKWWTTGVVEAGDNQTQSLENMDDAKKIERPHVLIYIHTKSITFTVKPTRPNSSQVSYNFPFKDELVPLKTMKLSTQPEDNPGDNQTDLFIIPQATMNILNSIITFDPNSQAMFESEIKLQCKTSTQDLASKSNTHLNQTTSSALEFNQSNQNIAISGQPVPILCTHNQSTTNSDDLGHLYLRATKDSKNLAFQNLVSPTSDIGLSDSTSSVNSKGGNEERDQNNTLNERQDLTTDSDYSSDSSNNCVSKTNLKKRKCIEEDRIEMKKRKIPSLKEDKKQSETTIHRKNDSSMDNSTTSNKDMELLLDYLDIDLNSFDIDEKTFDVELNALDNDDKNLEICDKDGNLMNDETQMSNKNTNVSAYNTNVSSDLEMFLQEMIYGESEKMLQMKSYLPDV